MAIFTGGLEKRLRLLTAPNWGIIGLTIGRATCSDAATEVMAI